MKPYLLGIDIGTSACKVAVFEKSGTVNMRELLAPLFRKRCSILIYPCTVRSSIARFTVDGDRLRSFAILLTDGQH